jgi:hypothetical protein
MTRTTIILGGQIRHEKLARWRQRFVGALEWLRVDRDGSHRARPLVARIHDGRVGALILLDGLIDHAFSAPVVAAARRRHVPILYAGRAGLARVAELLETISS